MKLLCVTCQPLATTLTLLAWENMKKEIRNLLGKMKERKRKSAIRMISSIYYAEIYHYSSVNCLGLSDTHGFCPSDPPEERTTKNTDIYSKMQNFNPSPSESRGLLVDYSGRFTLALTIVFGCPLLEGHAESLT